MKGRSMIPEILRDGMSLKMPDGRIFQVEEWYPDSSDDGVYVGSASMPGVVNADQLTFTRAEMVDAGFKYVG